MHPTTILFKFISIILVFILAVTAIPAAYATSSLTILYVKPGGLTTGACDSWTNACGLQYALSNASPGVGTHDEIWVAKGKYTPTTDTGHPELTFTLKDHVALYGGFQGIVSETQLSVRDWKNNITVLSGDIAGDDTSDSNGVVTNTDLISGINSYQVVTSSGTDNTAILDGFVVTAGYLDGYNHGGTGREGGAGLYNNAGSPTIQNITFSGNYVYYGAGAGMWSVNGGPTILNVTFVNNYADDSSGGGLYFYADVLHPGPGIPPMIGLTFKGNKSSHGGGPGGAYIGGNSNIQIINASFLGNSTACNGCGAHGGGIYDYMGSPGSLEITNSIFSGNTATGCGGGIDSGGGDSNFTLTNVTFSGNYAGTHGGALCAFINAKIVNSILWGDGAAQEAPETGDSSYTATFSDIQGGAAGAGNINVDPLFGSPVTASSTPTIAGDYHLQLTSPAIDAGNNDPVTAATDLGGYPRKMDVGTVVDTGHGTAPIVDLGAYETPGLPVANAGPDQHAATNVLITLDGSGSSDPVGRIPLTYLWVQTGGLDTPVTLLHSTDVKPTFTTPVVQSVKQITLTLVVTNKLGQASLPSSVRITIQPPLFIPLVRKN